MKNLNDVEVAILKAIIEENQDKYPFLKIHFPHIFIKKREFTGVGIYSNFEYSSLFEEGNINLILSSSKELTIANLENELAYVLYITNGKINFLEIVTNGNDSLEGEIKDFKLF